LRTSGENQEGVDGTMIKAMMRHDRVLSYHVEDRPEKSAHLPVHLK
jgi:hypothetical protein